MPRRATRRKAKTTKGWGKRAPKTKKQREALLKRCGPGAFLDPKNLKYPIMPKSGKCVIDCQGLRAAKSRAGQYHHRKLERKASKLASSAACAWER
jgi:hypothetical protein